MLVYRDLLQSVDVRTLLRQFAITVHEQLRWGRPSHAVAVRLLVEFGQLESAWCDQLMPDADTDLPQTRALRRVALGLGHLLYAAWRETTPSLHVRAIAGALEELQQQHWLPATPLRVKVPEGFAFYGLYPETYIQAAEEFARTRLPGASVCIGLRSIGAALSAVVAATLETQGWQVTSHTLRPRGEPFARRPVIAPAFAECLEHHASEYALLIDEGPGISGSSLAGTAAAFQELGYAEHRIVLFPSWKPDPQRLQSSDAQARWLRHTVFVGDFEQVWIDSGKLSDTPLRPMDQGRWRSLFFQTRDYPAVQPQHERRKFLTVERRPALLKFAGLGRFGDAAQERAQLLSRAKYTPPVGELRHGFLRHGFVTGTPLTESDCTPALLNNVARYLAFVQRNFPASQRTSGEELRCMVVANVSELLGWEAAAIPQLRDAQPFDDAPAVALDGRMQPWEWLATADGYLKTDALDHHADHFFPGGTDIAWDLAGFSIEFDLDQHGLELLSRRFIMHSGDTRIGSRLPLFRIAYAAFRAGYSALAEQATAATPEAVRFHRLTERYRRQLQQTLFDLRHRAHPCP